MSVQIEGDIAEEEPIEASETPAEVEAEQPADETPAEPEQEEATAEAKPEAEEELVVSIGEEAPEEDEKRAPEWVRELRKSNREKDRALRERDAELQRLRAQLQPAGVVVGEKPTLQGCDFDEDKFAAQLEAWHERKRQVEDQQRAIQQQQQRETERWQSRIDSVKAAASTLKVRDYDDAAQFFEDTFSPVQQGIVLDGPTDPKDAALLRYALGKNPAVAKKLAEVKNPVQFAFAVAKVLHKDLNVVPKKTAPPPDRPVRAAVAGASAVDNTLEKLRDEAMKTGDMRKLMQYKADLRQKQRA